MQPRPHRQKVDGLDVRYVRGTMRRMKKEYYHLSPAVGAAICNSFVLHNLYGVIREHTIEQWPFDPFVPLKTAKLVKELFYQATPTEELRPTQSKSQPAFWLDPHRIGQFVGLLTKRYSPNEMEALCKSWSDASGGSKEGIGKSKIMNFVRLVEEAMQECCDVDEKGQVLSPDPGKCSATKFLPPDMVIQILLAFMWAKCKTKADLIEYCQGLQSVVPAFEPSDLGKICDSSKWKKSGYDPGSGGFSIKDPATAWVSHAKNFERAVYHLSTRRFIAKSLPSLIPYEHRTAIRVPDCVEATIRNVVQLVLFDHRQECFTFNNLPACVSPSAPLRDFFAKYPYPIDKGHYTFMNAGNEWFTLLTKLPIPVSYIKSDFELVPSFNNLVIVLNYLFKLDCTTMTQFFEKVSSPQRQFKVTKSIHDGKVGEMTVAVTTETDTSVVSIIITSSHAKICQIDSPSCLFIDQARSLWKEIGIGLKSPFCIPTDKLDGRISVSLLAILMSSWSDLDRGWYCRDSVQLLETPSHVSQKACFFLMASDMYRAEKVNVLLRDFSETGCLQSLNLAGLAIAPASESSQLAAKYVLENFIMFNKSPVLSWNALRIVGLAAYPLHLAAAYGCASACEMLLSKGYKRDLQDGKFKTALQYAVGTEVALLLQQ